MEPGMKITLSKIDKITKEGLLESPYFFQCSPLESFRVSHSFEHTDYTTIKGQTFSRKSSKGLRTIQFQTLIVDWGSFVNVDVYDFSDLTDTLVKVCESGSPVKLTVDRGDDTSFAMDVTLRQFDVEEKAGEPDARYFDVTFTEWRDAYVVRKAKWPARHKLVRGDTLSSLATKYYGKPTLARIIAKANKITTFGFNTEIVKSKKWKVGDTIVVPAPPRSTANPTTGGVEAPAS